MPHLRRWEAPFFPSSAVPTARTTPASCDQWRAVYSFGTNIITGRRFAGNCCKIREQAAQTAPPRGHLGGLDACFVQVTEYQPAAEFAHWRGSLLVRSHGG